MANRYCVQCGQQNIPEEEAWSKYRCLPCFRLFNAALQAHTKGGGSLRDFYRTVTVHDTGWGRVGQIHWRNYPKHCRFCGGKLDPEKSSRVRHALTCGGECVTCDDCWMKRRYGSYTSDVDASV